MSLSLSPSHLLPLCLSSPPLPDSSLSSSSMGHEPPTLGGGLSSPWPPPPGGPPGLDPRSCTGGPPGWPGGGWLASKPGKGCGGPPGRAEGPVKPGRSNRVAGARGCPRSLGGWPSIPCGKRGCGGVALLPGGLRPVASILTVVMALETALRLRGSTRTVRGSCSEASGRSSGRKARGARSVQAGSLGASRPWTCLSAGGTRRSRRCGWRGSRRSRRVRVRCAGCPGPAGRHGGRVEPPVEGALDLPPEQGNPGGVGRPP